MSAATARITAALDSLPTLPIVALQIGEIIHSKNASVQQVAEILRTDPATSAKLLRLVNSPYFGIPGGVSDVARAIPFVGFNTLYQLVLSISVLGTLGTKSAPARDARALWVHSLTVATAARVLAIEINLSDPGTCFTAGLLHDMGKIALAKVEPAALSAAFEAVRAEGISNEEAERRLGLPLHDRLGSQLARQWRFPAPLAAAIEHHHAVHRPDGRRLAPHLRTSTEIVAAADHLSHACAATFGESLAGEDGEAQEPDLFERNGFSAAQREGLCDRTRRELERTKIFLSLLDS